MCGSSRGAIFRPCVQLTVPRRHGHCPTSQELGLVLPRPPLASGARSSSRSSSRVRSSSWDRFSRLPFRCLDRRSSALSVHIPLDLPRGFCVHSTRPARARARNALRTLTSCAVVGTLRSKTDVASVEAEIEASSKPCQRVYDRLFDLPQGACFVKLIWRNTT